MSRHNKSDFHVLENVQYSFFGHINRHYNYNFLLSITFYRDSTESTQYEVLYRAFLINSIEAIERESGRRPPSGTVVGKASRGDI